MHKIQDVMKKQKHRNYLRDTIFGDGRINNIIFFNLQFLCIGKNRIEKNLILVLKNDLNLGKME